MRKVHRAHNRTMASSTTFVAIVLVLALVGASFATVLTIRQIGQSSQITSTSTTSQDNPTTTTTISNYTVPYSSSMTSTTTSTSSLPSLTQTLSTTSLSFTSATSSTVRNSNTTFTSPFENVLVYGNATVGDFTGECGGGFHPIGVTFTSDGVNYDSPVTNLSYYPSNNTGPGPSLEGYATGQFAMTLPNFEMYNVTVQQDNYCNSNDYVSSCPAGSFYLYAISTKEGVKADCTTDNTTQFHGYAIMFMCVEGCVQNLTGYSLNDTNAQMAWGVNESSYGGYSGGIAYNPACWNCSTNVSSEPNKTQYGYEYPWPDYATYTIQPIGIFSNEPYVNISSILFGVAYGGVGNHIFTTPQYLMTIRVDLWQVPITGRSIYMSYPMCNTSPCTGFQFVNSTFITVYPNVACGGFSSNRNETCA